VPIETESHACEQFLRMGAQVVVLEPYTLRQKLAATAAEITARYGDLTPLGTV
jgi:hypothetical protein